MEVGTLGHAARAARARFVWGLAVGQCGIPLGIVLGSVALYLRPSSVWEEWWAAWLTLVGGLVTGVVMAFVFGRIVWHRRARQSSRQPRR